MVLPSVLVLTVILKLFGVGLMCSDAPPSDESQLPDCARFPAVFLMIFRMLVYQLMYSRVYLAIHMSVVQTVAIASRAEAVLVFWGCNVFLFVNDISIYL